MKLDRLPYRHIIAADFEFEFGSVDGNRPRPVCMVARELHGPDRRGGYGGASSDHSPPFLLVRIPCSSRSMRPPSLDVSEVLGWEMPARILDLFCEFRARTNGILRPAGGRL